MENGWKFDGPELDIENDECDGVVAPRLANERIVHPNSDSKLTIEVVWGQWHRGCYQPNHSSASKFRQVKTFLPIVYLLIS